MKALRHLQVGISCGGRAVAQRGTAVHGAVVGVGVGRVHVLRLVVEHAVVGVRIRWLLRSWNILADGGAPPRGDHHLRYVISWVVALAAVYVRLNDLADFGELERLDDGDVLVGVAVDAEEEGAQAGPDLLGSGAAELVVDNGAGDQQMHAEQLLHVLNNL